MKNLFPILIVILLTTPAHAGLFSRKKPDPPQPVVETVIQPVAEPAAAVPVPVPSPAVQRGDEMEIIISKAHDEKEYTIGIDDILEISILQPEEWTNTVTVAPDGKVTVPYIGSSDVSGRTVAAVQAEIRDRLADGYMKYPVVSVALVESRSQKFFVYGEVLKPGSYPMEANTTVLRAIAMAGGFTKFGSSSRVKVLRPRDNAPGYESIKVDIKAVMDGNAWQDQLLTQGDIVVVSEGIF